eukprot:40439-Eustigmatos_ZCMA.PRE.1
MTQYHGTLTVQQISMTRDDIRQTPIRKGTGTVEMVSTEKEQEMVGRGYEDVYGVEEAGRGALAGPVIVMPHSDTYALTPAQAHIKADRQTNTHC